MDVMSSSKRILYNAIGIKSFLSFSQFNISFKEIVDVISSDHFKKMYTYEIQYNTLTVDQDQFEFEPDRPFVPALVTRGKYRPGSILCQRSSNFDGAARLLAVPGLAQAYFTNPTSLQLSFSFLKRVFKFSCLLSFNCNAPKHPHFNIFNILELFNSSQHIDH